MLNKLSMRFYKSGNSFNQFYLYLDMNDFRVDKSAFWCGTHEENAKRTKEYWDNKSIKERLIAATYLNSQAWNYDLNNPPKVDKTLFSHRVLPE